MEWCDAMKAIHYCCSVSYPPYTLKEVGRDLWHHLQVPYCSYHVISAEVGSQIANKMSNLRYPLIAGNLMLYNEKRRPLLLKYFITFIRCIRKMGGTHDSILSPLIKVDSQIAHKTPHLGYPPCTRNGTIYYKEGYPLLLKYFPTFFRCISRIGGTSDSNFEPHCC